MKNMKKIPFFLVFAILIVCYLGLNNNKSDAFEKINEQYENKIAVNLDKNLKPRHLSAVLYNNGYVNTQEDADFLAEFITLKLKNDTVPQALSDLEKRMWQIPQALIEQKGTDYLRKRLANTQANTGWTEDIDSFYQAQCLPTHVNVGDGEDGMMTVIVKDPKPDSLITWQDKLRRTKALPSKGVVVQLKKYSKNESNTPDEKVIAYAQTDENGKAYFEGLAADSSYSVLPVRKGFSYGSEKGTYLGTWGRMVEDEQTEFSFSSTPLKIKAFNSQTLRTIRQDGVITVRSPETYNNMLSTNMIIFLAVWLVLFAVGNTGKRRMDNLLAAGMMLITGLSMLLMFSINNPLTERVLGVEMAQGCIAGTILAIGLMMIDMRKFFQNGYKVKFDIFIWFMKAFGNFIAFFGFGRLYNWISKKMAASRACQAVANSWKKATGWITMVDGKGYLYGGILLTLCLFFFGSEVGGMKVNLNLGITFQPSEIVKYMLVVFMAAYFFEKGDSIIAYSQAQPDGGGNLLANIGKKLLVLSGLLIGLLIMLAFYLKLGDMGPALVVILTFLVIYSLIKSRFVFESDDLRTNLKQLLQCDLAIMLFGVATFVIMLLIGSAINQMFLFTFLWFIGWIMFGWNNGRRFYETAFMFNLIITAFVFGGKLLTALGAEDVAERLMQRNSMCFNTWGTIGGEPGVNTQVAEGLWALASGGFTGQGLGNAQAHFIPAFHTDMVLQSIGEMLGFFGIAGVIFLLSLLLRRAILIGYRSGHPFLLYLCSGIAIVTGIQLFIISLGSLGIIPLTGITVPFFSFGRVSLVLNILAFAIVLSVSARNHQIQKKHTKAYNDTIGILSLAYTLLAIFVLGTIAHYQIGPNRDATIIRPVYVYDTQGAAVISYNPRINYLTARMQPGNIYDRNGVLLATSKPKLLKETKYVNVYDSLKLGNIDELTKKVQKRYYPFGNHLFFMLGDFNNQYYFSSVDNVPFGYLAESKHLSEIRGYDTRLKDEDGDFVIVTLKSDKYKKHRFMPEEELNPEVQLRDYSALLPFLKAGVNSDLVKEYNKGNETISETDVKNDGSSEMLVVKPSNLQLTVDAKLQTLLQNRIPEYLKKRWGKGLEKRNLERYSVVVMDAENGDLLASANYPLPDYDRIAESQGRYSDSKKDANWTSFTERDLGLTYATPPGSTAKVMSALAGLIHMDAEDEHPEMNKYKFHVDKKETIDRPIRDNKIYYLEPYDGNYKAIVDMSDAIKYSSNCYFINLVNKYRLYEELATIYSQAGISVNNMQPYYLQPNIDGPKPEYMNYIIGTEARATEKYDRYMEQRDPNNPKTIMDKMKGHNHLADEAWYWAWGQGKIDATPAAMARVAATAATSKMPVTRYRMDEKVSTNQLFSEKLAAYIQEYMQGEAYKPNKSNQWNNFLSFDMGGKTGTPERSLNGKVNNDAWYICYVNNAMIPSDKGRTNSKIAIALRIERSGSSQSDYAKAMTANVVFNTLQELGYIKPEPKKDNKKKK